MKILPVSRVLGVSASVLLSFGAAAAPAGTLQLDRDAGGSILLAQIAPAPQTDTQSQSDQSLGLAPAPAPTLTAPAPATQQPAPAVAPPAVILTPNGTRQPSNTAATNGNVQPNGKPKRGQTGATLGSAQPSGLLPTYGSTSTSNGPPQTESNQQLGGTQRNPTNTLLGDTATYDEQQVYGGTQSTLGTPRTNGTLDSGRTQAYGGTQQGLGTQQTGGTSQGGGTIYTRQPLGALPITRDLTGPYGGANGFDARGVYTGTAAQPLSYGQPYATTRGINNNLLGDNLDARSVTRPFIPLGNGPIRPNSGYGVPNGSKSTYMDARGIQRSN